MNHKLSGPVLVIALAVSACASVDPVPKDFTGPTARLQDTGEAESGGKARLYAAVAIDGANIPNAFSASARASHGQGNSLTMVTPSRKVKAMPMKVTVRCSHTTAAPIAAMASQVAGTFFSVEGVVDFTPLQDARYVVKGDLKKEKSSCWIEDEATGKQVTTAISK